MVQNFWTARGSVSNEFCIHRMWPTVITIITFITVITFITIITIIITVIIAITRGLKVVKYTTRLTADMLWPSFIHLEKIFPAVLSIHRKCLESWESRSQWCTISSIDLVNNPHTQTRTPRTPNPKKPQIPIYVGITKVPLKDYSASL